jgi:DNA polymerase-3 subunit alpha
VNKRVLEALAKAGALDTFGPREAVLAGLDRALAAGQQIQRAAGVGQGSLFGFEDGLKTASSLPSVPPASDQQRLTWEKESLGFFLSNHPFQAAAPQLASVVTLATSQVSEELDKEAVVMAGAVMSVRKVVTKRQETMCIAQIEDLHGAIEAVVFPRTYAANPELWAEDAIVIVRGKLAFRRVDTQNEEEARGVAEIIVDAAEAWIPGQEPTALVTAVANGVSRARRGATNLKPGTPGATAVPGSPPDASGAVLAESAAPPWHDDDAPAADALYAPPPSELSAPFQADTLDSDADGTPGGGCPPAAAAPLTLVFRESGDRMADVQRLERLHQALAAHPGDAAYTLRIEIGGERMRVEGEELRLTLTPSLQVEIESILGAGALVQGADAA